MVLWTKTVPQLETINCIDADAIMLECELDNHFRPPLLEMVFGRKTSPLPVDINVFQGDIAVPDDRLQADCFTLIEMIEHITLEHLEKVTRTVFGYYRPKSVVVSTPNIEFNILLKEQAQEKSIGAPSFKSPDNNLRHFDHKFEWTRLEFVTWVQNVSREYGYNYIIDGVGELPGSEPYGPCTQVAIFQLDPAIESGINTHGNLECFDLLINKLSVDERQSEYLGDLEKKRICLMAKYTVPGCQVDNTTTTIHDYDWSELATVETEPLQECGQTMI